MEKIFETLSHNFISALLLGTLASGFVMALAPQTAAHFRVKRAAFAMACAVFMASLYLYFNFDTCSAAMQFAEKRAWIPGLNAFYSVGVDGLSLFLVLLTTFLTPIVVLATNAGDTRNLSYYFSLFFFLEFTMIGALVARDALLFYLFWELMLVPMYLIIGVWGGPDRVRATIKFLLYTIFGSVFMLWGLFWMVSYHNIAAGRLTFDIAELAAVNIEPAAQKVLFLLFGIAFMVKIPVFPFHTWLPHAHVEAPTGGSVILAAVLLKMGAYGLLRFSIPMFPAAAAEFSVPMMALGAFGVVYGAMMSYAQTDLKKLVAYSSVSHMGAIVTGIFALNAAGVTGAIVQMTSHGVSTGALFLLVGAIYERRHTRAIGEFGGLAAVMPVYSTIFAIVTFSSIGLPGLNGFVGEFLILLGAFGASPAVASVAALGVVLGAVYMLTVYEKVFLGKMTKKENEKLPDLRFSERMALTALIVAILAVGVYPGFVTSRIERGVMALVAPFEKPASAKTAALNEKAVGVCRSAR